jgi:hypothetical protein
MRYRAAIDAVVVVDCEIAVSLMWLDNGEFYWLAAPRAGVVDINGQRHVISFAPGELGHSMGSNLGCEGLGCFATAPQSGVDDAPPL